MKFARYGLIAILLSILFLPLHASAVPLNDLLDSGASITEGDKLFSNFTGFYVATAGGNPSSIDVSTSTVGGEQRLQLGEGYVSQSVVPWSCTSNST